MKKLLLILLAIIIIVVGVAVGLSSLYFIAAPLPKWLTENPVASFFLFNQRRSSNICICFNDTWIYYGVLLIFNS
ncbi:hypothetical protein IPJ63_00520 [Candidatus Nomurabacteria bacterium]|nr:MAG: hypothetical protein IPJ63_00520 [Candidatus Nomurabacteria bacterium]